MERQPDRLMSDRETMNKEVAYYNMMVCHDAEEEEEEESSSSSRSEEYADRLAQCLFNTKGALEKEKMLSLTKKPKTPLLRFHEKLQRIESSPVPLSKKKTKEHQEINTTETRILDAPGICNDYYSSIMDWGVYSNMVGVALGSDLYVWKEIRGGVREPTLLTTLANDEKVMSVLMGHDNYVMIGTEEGRIEVWDFARELQIRTLRGHTAHIGTLDQHQHILSSGSRDTSIINWDLRMREAQICQITHQHTREVCVLKWNANGSLLASGGTDEALCLWSMTNRALEKKIESAHRATIKALAWCPLQSNLLASGAGTDDGCIKFWQTHSHTLLDTINTGAQISALRWCESGSQLISAHGYSSNEIVLWRYPTMRPLARLSSHTGRVLGIALSPDQSTLLSASADETLRYWQIRTPPVISPRRTRSFSGIR